MQYQPWLTQSIILQNLQSNQLESYQKNHATYANPLTTLTAFAKDGAILSRMTHALQVAMHFLKTSPFNQQLKRIRFETFNNADSYYPATVWKHYKKHGGQPKPSELVKRPATVWSLLIHDPDRCEGCELHHFNSKIERDEFIKQYKNNPALRA